MSALDLDALEARCKDTIAEWTLVYAQSGETLPDDAVETKAARETLALITRLRAAEARTAWQPIETAPMGEWVLVYGTRFRAALPSVEPARLDEYGWADKGGYSVRPTHWQPLPTAPEAPHG